MDEIIGALVREAGKQYAEAQKRAAAEAALRRPPPPPPARTAAPTPASILAPPPDPPLAPLRVTPPSPARPNVVANLPDEPAFETVVAPVLAGVPVAKADLHLLTAFQSPSGLLAGIVLYEALAPPVALRGSQLFGRIER